MLLLGERERRRLAAGVNWGQAAGHSHKGFRKGPGIAPPPSWGGLLYKAAPLCKAWGGDACFPPGGEEMCLGTWLS